MKVKKADTVKFEGVIAPLPDGSYARFRSVTAARCHLVDKKLHDQIVRGPEDLVSYKPDELKAIYRRVTKELAPSGKVDQKKFATRLWDTLVSRSVDRMFDPEAPKGKRAEARANPEGYKLLEADEAKLLALDLPKQAKVCIIALAKAKEAAMSEERVMSLIKQAAAAGDLKTKQDPWRIFQYYRPVLIKAGLIKLG